MDRLHGQAPAFIAELLITAVSLSDNLVSQFNLLFSVGFKYLEHREFLKTLLKDLLHIRATNKSQRARELQLKHF